MDKLGKSNITLYITFWAAKAKIYCNCQVQFSIKIFTSTLGWSPGLLGAYITCRFHNEIIKDSCFCWKALWIQNVLHCDNLNQIIVEIILIEHLPFLWLFFAGRNYEFRLCYKIPFLWRDALSSSCVACLPQCHPHMPENFKMKNKSTYAWSIYNWKLKPNMPDQFKLKIKATWQF